MTMKKQMKVSSRGFTLVEVLIVVIIIAILAALLLPRLFPQTERPIITEAQQILGAIKRAQITHGDTTGSDEGLAFNCDGTDDCADDNLTTLGLEIGRGNFSYDCTETDCTATRLGGGTYNGGTITINYGFGNGNGWFSCDGAIYQQVSAADGSKGCTTV